MKENVKKKKKKKKKKNSSPKEEEEEDSCSHSFDEGGASWRVPRPRSPGAVAVRPDLWIINNLKDY